MKKRIFIHMHYMEIGGAETALIGLLQSLDHDNVEVDLFLNEHRGEMMKYIPEWINLLPEKKAYSVVERPILQALKKLQFGVVAGRLIARFKFNNYYRKKKPKETSAIFGYVGKFVAPFLPSLKHLGKYDRAISFLTPHNIVLEKVDARKKICWIHTDYSSIDVNERLELPVWNGYDHIVSISPEVTKGFINRFPELQNKIIEIRNIISRDFVMSRVKEFVPDEMTAKNDEQILLTIGRYAYAKAHENIPVICRILLKKGLKVKWYIIGYGEKNEEEKIKTAIKENEVEENVILLGKKANPYPYIAKCDWYIQPSRFEGDSVTVREAQLLGKPVIITDYPTAQSQVKNGVDGIIVPMDMECCIKEICHVVQNIELKASICKNLQKQNIEDYIRNRIYCLFS